MEVFSFELVVRFPEIAQASSSLLGCCNHHHHSTRSRQAEDKSRGAVVCLSYYFVYTSSLYRIYFVFEPGLPLHIAGRDANPYLYRIRVYCARRDIPSARNVYAYCRRRQQNFQNTVSALGRDARIISRQSRNTSSASEGIETVRPYIAADDEAYGTREKAKRPVCSVRFRKTCPKSGTTRLIGKR